MKQFSESTLNFIKLLFFLFILLKYAWYHFLCILVKKFFKFRLTCLFESYNFLMLIILQKSIQRTCLIIIFYLDLSKRIRSHFWIFSFVLKVQYILTEDLFIFFLNIFLFLYDSESLYLYFSHFTKSKVF